MARNVREVGLAGDRSLRADLREAGYGDAQIDAGLAWARRQGDECSDATIRSLVMSHILYDAGSLADGVRWSAEPAGWDRVEG